MIGQTETSCWFDAVPNERVAIRVHSRQVDGAFAIVESVARPGAAAPRHMHREDEVFYVLSGRPTFLLGKDLFQVRPGGTVLIPRDTVHAWVNATNEDLRMLATFVPGGIEDLFRDIGGLSPDEIEAKAAAYGTRVVGPPLSSGTTAPGLRDPLAPIG